MVAQLLHVVFALFVTASYQLVVTHGCDCSSYPDVSAEATVFESPSLPSDACCVASVGNGYLATVVFSDTIHLNRVYNGRYGSSHRADIPSPAHIRVDTNSINISNETYSLDVLNGTFHRRSSTEVVHIHHKVYAHQVLTRLLINEITLTRKPGTAGQISVDLALKFNPESEDVNITVVPPKSEDAWFAFGNTTTSETPTSAVSTVYMYWTEIPKVLTLAYKEDTHTWCFITSVSTSKADALDSYVVGEALGRRLSLFRSHAEAWRDKWEEGHIDVTGNLYLAKAIYGSLYYIMSFLPPLTQKQTAPFRFYGINPGGLAHGGLSPAGYKGHIFWDQETWMYPTILMLHPQLALEILKTRTSQLDAAKENAQKNGYKGAQFPWEMAFTGMEVCPATPYPTHELHITGDIAFAVQQYLSATNDTDFLLQERGFEMIIEIAEFWASKAKFDQSRKMYTINDVMPPDEYHQSVNNSVYTNVIAQISLRLPAYAASMINKTVPDNWTQIAEQLYIPYDKNREYHPEYEGYTLGTEVKQADAILLGFPLMHNMSTAARRNDLMFYEAYNGVNVTDPNGPAMTWGMFAVGWLELGNQSKAGELFEKSYANIQQPFKIWTETAQGEGAINFVTGMGGFLQAVMYGYGGMRLRETGLYMNITIPPESQSITFTGIEYFGNSLSISATEDKVEVVLTDNSGVYRRGVELEVLQGTDVHSLVIDIPIILSREAFMIRASPQTSSNKVTNSTHR
ncbi:protein-glucosylgalactosylhydroxylysine glucosidase-like [Diadema antillarum]|uniref:protein-glucosylgalactosylhydroxylysine glucosidase-like n=1 Tax=Diadema antillarum TaxID=105358 RepID=UPI003A894A62